jgi:NADH-quinone oxidoreductase subunit C
MNKTDFLNEQLEKKVEEFGLKIIHALNETTVSVKLSSYIDFLIWAKDELSFEQLIDLCTVDYLEYNNYDGARYAVVLHLLSIKNNVRLRVKVFVEEDNPIVPSITKIWSSANWYEREAFDLYGILFEGHNDLRRILTDYGFIGHPMQKDFPTTGFVEMRYDEEQKRVIYQPVTIEDRLTVPRIIREESYAH